MKDRIESFMEYKYVGGHDASGHPLGYITGLPARDLWPDDVLCALENQGITQADIDASLLYESVYLAEVAPMCGAELADGGECKRPVEEWGQRCWQHKDTES